MRLTGPLRLAIRLAARDMRFRPGTGLLVLVALLAATSTMTLALVVRGSAQAPWDQTFAATTGPHVVATTFDADRATDRVMADLAVAPEVVAHAGPYPLLAMPDGALQAHGRRIDVEVMARDGTPAAVDRPALTSGGWIRDGGAVVEESFAAALRLAVGDAFTIAGRPFTVAGIAVTTSRQPTPFYSHGLVWTTRTDAEALAPAAAHRGTVLMLRLADPNRAPQFASSNTSLDYLYLDDWQSTRQDALTDVLFALFGLIVGAVSLALLAAASVAVAVAGRMASQTRRAAVLQAAGATPRFVATVMLAEYLSLALVAGLGGLLAGTLLAPALAHPVPGVLGTAPLPHPSATTVALVLGTAAVLVGLSTVVPSIRAARASTVQALANPARPPRRSRLAVAISGRLPVPLLLGLRLVARRPGRAVLAAAGLSVTVAAVVVALWMEAGIRGDVAQVTDALGEHAVTYDKLRLVTYAFIAALVALALVNAVLVAWTTALDNARNSALARALGASPRQVTTGLTVASLLPALGALTIGIPAGFAAFSLAASAAGSSSASPTPAAAGLLALLPATLLLVAVLTTIPSHRASLRPPIEALRTD
ncbi:MAG TPA: FtsX-like permease family protein [Micromonosporaceae bacterium]|nr:FtsX-like permease family protein [Micromonosporaceae bacterium]